MVTAKVGVLMEICSVTGIGAREENQDKAGWIIKDEACCAVVCDGLGGYRNGRTAAEEAVKCFLGEFEKKPDIKEKDLKTLTDKCHRRLLELKPGQSVNAGMMTTIAAVVVRKGSIYACHIGDTRIYVFRNGSLVFQTKDHSMGQTLAAFGTIGAEEIRNSPYRNKLLRALGGQEEPPVCEVVKIEMADEYAVLICTDGFWEYIYEKEMELLHRKSSSSKDWLAAMEGLLKQRAGSGGDNYTAVALETERC